MIMDTNYEDCCHPVVEVVFVKLESYDLAEVTVLVQEICEVCNEKIDEYTLTYKRDY